MSSSWAMVMFSPLATSGRYRDTGSSRPILPSSTSCRITVAGIVLVLLPIRTWAAGGSGAGRGPARARPRPRSAQPVPPLVAQLQDRRGGHRLGVAADPDVVGEGDRLGAVPGPGAHRGGPVAEFSRPHRV